MERRVAIIMGSDSDWEVMAQAKEVLDGFGVESEIDIVSAHRTPEKMFCFSKVAHEKFAVIIAGAGGAAHLPGMVAAVTTLPVIGVPILSRNSIDGWDSILSVLQMPAGVPVATVALGGAKNAGVLATQILAVSDAKLSKKIVEYKKGLETQIKSSAKKLVQEIKVDVK